MQKKQNGFIDFILLLTKWRKFLFINLFIVGVASHLMVTKNN